MKRTLKIAAIAVGILLLLLVGGVAAALALVDIDGIVNQQVAKIEPQIEEQLGRKVEIGRISTSLLPTLGGRVEQVSIAQDTTKREDDQPLVAIEAIGFELSLWDAIVSLGDRIVVDRIYLEGMKVSLVRYPDGTLSYQDILDRQAAKAEPEPEPAKDEPAKPLDPEVQKYLRNVSISQVRIADAEFRLVDFATATGERAESFVRRFNVALDDVRITDPIKVRVDAAVFSDSRNFEVETEIGPLPADLQLAGAPRIGFVKLKMTDVDLSRIAPYLGPAVPARIDSALASSEYRIGELSEDKPIDIDGYLAVRSLQIAGGEKFDLRVDSRLKLDQKALSAQIEQLDVQLGQVELKMKGALEDLATAPKFKDFSVRSANLDPAVLLRYYPPAAESLPKGTRIAGPIVLSAIATGDANAQNLKADVDLSKLDVLYPGTLVKPAGVAMGVSVEGDFTGSDAKLKEARARLDELDLVVSGTVKNFAKPSFDLTAAAKPFSFDRLARLLPALKEGLESSNTRASGDGKLAAKLKGSATDLDASLVFELLGVKLDVPDTHLEGDLRIQASAKGNPEQNLRAELLFDADKALVQVKDVMNKAPTTPLLLKAAVAKVGGKIDVEKFDLTLAELKLTAVGSLDQGKGTTNLKVEMQPLDLGRFAKTVTAIPQDKAKNGLVDVKLAVSGNPNQLSTMSVAIHPLNVRYGRSDLRGEMKVDNLEKPRVDMKVSSRLLDVDELMGEPQQTSAGQQPGDAKSGEEKPAEDDPSLKEYAFKGLVNLERVIYGGEEYRNFRGEVTLQDGVLRLVDCTFEIYGGTVSAKGTEAEIWRAKMPFKANLAVQKIDLNKALSAKTKYKDLLFGVTDLNLQVSGRGFETKDLEQSLSGALELAMKEGRFAKGSVTKSVLGDAEVLSKVPGVKLDKLQADNAIRDLLASFEIKDGKLNLKKPMALALDRSRMTLDGAIGIAGGLFMKGTYFVSPEAVQSLSGGKCSSQSELAVPIDVGGTLGEPGFKPDVKGLAQSIASACLAGKVGEAADKVKDELKSRLGVSSKEEAEQKAREAVEAKRKEAEEKARAAAEQARQEAEARARAEAERAKAEAARLKAETEAKLRAEAEAKKKAAEEAAKQKAKEEASKALKGKLGF